MAAASPLTCPACHATLTQPSKFCPACGADMSAPPAAPGPVAPSGAPPASGTPPPPPPPPPSAGPAPVDIRERVEQDRGMLKRLQLLVPGYRGYRQGEDARAADSFLRLQIADKVHRSVLVVQDCRQRMTAAGLFQGLMDLAPVLSDLQVLEGEIRHAEQGYTGISPALRITPAQIDRLYEYDYGFATAAEQVNATLAPLQASSSGTDGPAVQSAIATVRTQVRALDNAFKARIRAIEGILVQ
jgi:hypothetical protein